MGKVQTIRVGNHKFTYAEAGGVPVIEASNLEDSWMVRIPAHFEMYGILNRLLEEHGSEDSVVRSHADEWLGMFAMNWANVTGIPNGYYHQGLAMLTSAYARPELLRSSFFGDGKRFYADVKTLRTRFLAWSKEAEALRRNAEKDFDADSAATADAMKQIADGEEEAVSE